MTEDRHAAPKVSQALVASKLSANERPPIQNDGELATHTRLRLLLFATLGDGGVCSVGSGSNRTPA
jgi:hypothetical protein